MGAYLPVDRWHAKKRVPSFTTMVVLHNGRFSYICLLPASSFLTQITSIVLRNWILNVACGSRKCQASAHFLHSSGTIRENLKENLKAVICCNCLYSLIILPVKRLRTPFSVIDEVIYSLFSLLVDKIAVLSRMVVNSTYVVPSGC